jgi:hypothetical protein
MIGVKGGEVEGQELPFYLFHIITICPANGMPELTNHPP